jgi:hypothetical protein
LLAREDHIFVRSLPPSPALSCFFISSLCFRLRLTNHDVPRGAHLNQDYQKI